MDGEDCFRGSPMYALGKGIGPGRLCSPAVESLVEAATADEQGRPFWMCAGEAVAVGAMALPTEWGVMQVESTLDAVQAALGYTFRDQAMLERALTHASVSDTRVDSNERLEFLGDAVLGLIVSERVYHRFPEYLEGELTKIKSAAVSRQTCAEIAAELGLDRAMVLGKGLRTQHEIPSSLAAAVLESIIAAIYLDGGYKACEDFLAPLVDPIIERAAECGHQENYKSVLQRHAQQVLGIMPAYRVLDEKGPDHQKCFKICVELNGDRYEPAWGQSKKRAEQMAALNALHSLGLIRSREDGRYHVVEVAELE